MLKGLEYAGIFIAMVLLQVLLFNNIQIGGFLNIYGYLLFVLLLPMNIPGWALLLCAASIGVSVDFVRHGGYQYDCYGVRRFYPSVDAAPVRRSRRNSGRGCPLFRKNRYEAFCALRRNFGIGAEYDYFYVGGALFREFCLYGFPYCGQHDRICGGNLFLSASALPET